MYARTHFLALDDALLHPGGLPERDPTSENDAETALSLPGDVLRPREDLCLRVPAGRLRVVHEAIALRQRNGLNRSQV